MPYPMPRCMKINAFDLPHSSQDVALLYEITIVGLPYVLRFWFDDDRELVVKVTFIDYGNTAAVSMERLVLLTPEVQKQFPALVCTKALSIKCSLHGVKPNPVRNARNMWDEDSIKA